ncbi:hypothetical protein HYT33_00410 [Candidatus Roizmanbacteria bacterium]|nr:hypothetical protein [Candidatus Roizmanbacteria bacterium]
MNIDTQTILSILSLLGIGGVIGAYFNHLLEKKREMELRVVERREDQYKRFLENIIGFFEGWIDKERQKNFMEELYTHAPLYASDEVIKLSNKYLKSFSSKKDSSERDKYYKELVVIIRKELRKLQGEKTDLTEKDINILKLDK